MPELNFPDPAVTNPWVDPNGQSWQHDGDGWGKTPVAASPTGYKNVLINGRLGNVTDPWIINQRGFDGDWNNIADGVFAYDRWKFIEFSAIGNQKAFSQTIELANVVNDFETDYVFSFAGGGTGYFKSPNGTEYTGASPIAVKMHTGSANPEIQVLESATNVQLELGTVPTAFEIRPVGLELSLCHRYYWIGVHSGNNIDLMPIAPNPTGDVAANRRVVAVYYPESMRIAPNVLSLTLSNGSLESQLITEDYVRFAVQTDSDAQPSAIILVKFDAEII